MSKPAAEKAPAGDTQKEIDHAKLLELIKRKERELKAYEATAQQLRKTKTEPVALSNAAAPPMRQASAVLGGTDPPRRVVINPPANARPASAGPAPVAIRVIPPSASDSAQAPRAPERDDDIGSDSSDSRDLADMDESLNAQALPVTQRRMVVPAPAPAPAASTATTGTDARADESVGVDGDTFLDDTNLQSFGMHESSLAAAGYGAQGLHNDTTNDEVNATGETDTSGGLPSNVGVMLFRQHIPELINGLQPLMKKLESNNRDVVQQNEKTEELRGHLNMERTRMREERDSAVSRMLGEPSPEQEDDDYYDSDSITSDHSAPAALHAAPAVAPDGRPLTPRQRTNDEGSRIPLPRSPAVPPAMPVRTDSSDSLARTPEDLAAQLIAIARALSPTAPPAMNGGDVHNSSTESFLNNESTASRPGRHEMHVKFADDTVDSPQDRPRLSATRQATPAANKGTVRRRRRPLPPKEGAQAALDSRPPFHVGNTKQPRPAPPRARGAHTLVDGEGEPAAAALARQAAAQRVAANRAKAAAGAEPQMKRRVPDAPHQAAQALAARGPQRRRLSDPPAVLPSAPAPPNTRREGSSSARGAVPADRFAEFGPVATETRDGSQSARGAPPSDRYADLADPEEVGDYADVDETHNSSLDGSMSARGVAGERPHGLSISTYDFIRNALGGSLFSGLPPATPESEQLPVRDSPVEAPKPQQRASIERASRPMPALAAEEPRPARRSDPAPTPPLPQQAPPTQQLNSVGQPVTSGLRRQGTPPTRPVSVPKLALGGVASHDVASREDTELDSAHRMGNKRDEAPVDVDEEPVADDDDPINASHQSMVSDSLTLTPMPRTFDRSIAETPSDALRRTLARDFDASAPPPARPPPPATTAATTTTTSTAPTRERPSSLGATGPMPTAEVAPPPRTTTLTASAGRNDPPTMMMQTAPGRDSIGSRTSPSEPPLSATVAAPGSRRASNQPAQPLNGGGEAPRRASAGSTPTQKSLSSPRTVPSVAATTTTTTAGSSDADLPTPDEVREFGAGELGRLRQAYIEQTVRVQELEAEVVELREAAAGAGEGAAASEAEAATAALQAELAEERESRAAERARMSHLMEIIRAATSDGRQPVISAALALYDAARREYQ